MSIMQVHTSETQDCCRGKCSSAHEDSSTTILFEHNKTAPAYQLFIVPSLICSPACKTRWGRPSFTILWRKFIIYLFMQASGWIWTWHPKLQTVSFSAKSQIPYKLLWTRKWRCWQWKLFTYIISVGKAENLIQPHFFRIYAQMMFWCTYNNHKHFGIQNSLDPWLSSHKNGFFT
jgi:hypothetical protein